VAIGHEKATENPHLGGNGLATMIEAPMQIRFHGMHEADSKISIQIVIAIRKILRYRFQYDPSVSALNPKEMGKMISLCQATFDGKIEEFQQDSAAAVTPKSAQFIKEWLPLLPK
jgi:hypothetical protein